MSHQPAKQLGFFERHLTLWVFLCLAAGLLLGTQAPDAVNALSRLELAQGSHVNLPIAVLIWLMIFPMMLKVDFRAVAGVARKPTGLLITLFVNWIVKPLSMAFLAWIFLRQIFAGWISPADAENYTAGLIILAAAPCTAMVFVWSYLTDGDPAYTLVQVAVNDLIMLVAFAPIVMFFCGVSNVIVPPQVLLTSVVVFIVTPLVAACITRTLLLQKHSPDWLERVLLPRFQPVTMVALLFTLVLIFAFQAQNLLRQWFIVILLALPIILQVYFNSGLTYVLMRSRKVPHSIAAPGALIGASNFFELAVAVAITLFGPSSGAALATVVGVLVEVPVMLSICRLCQRTRGWYDQAIETK